MHLDKSIRKILTPVSWYFLLIACLFLLSPAVAHAGFWAEPGNIQFRHDLNLLRDTGYINIPLSAWPLSMRDVANAVNSVNEQSIQDPRVMDALKRISRKLRQEKKTGFKKPRAKLSLTSDSLEYRTFMDTPRGRGELDLSLEWMGKRFAFNLEGQGVYDPDDDRNFRPDGTMGGMILGNWMLSAGYMSRWWSPSPLDSLIMSSNARPFPAVSIQRNLTEPFDLPVLNYLGRWDFRMFAGLLEEDRHISRPKFFGMRVDFCLTDKLEIGLSRTMQWGGQGEPEKLDVLAELAFIPNNQIDETEGTGSNQLAGYDARWRSPFYGDFPYALYGQYIAEDVMHGKPIKYLDRPELNTGEQLIFWMPPIAYMQKWLILWHSFTVPQRKALSTITPTTKQDTAIAANASDMAWTTTAWYIPWADHCSARAEYPGTDSCASAASTGMGVEETLSPQ